ncbi:hypothetical protein ACROYT_G005072 [Oculina patagonica]
MCWSVLRQEFRLIHFRLQYPNSADFAQSPWFGVPVVLLYRFVIATFCFSSIIWSAVIFRRNGPKWLIYLSNWSFSFVTLYFVCATIATAIHYRKQRKQGEHNVGDQAENGMRNFASSGNSDDGGQPGITVGNGLVHDDADEIDFATDGAEASRVFPMTWFHEALWVVYNIAGVAALVVTLSYWLLLFSSRNKLSALSVIVHGVNSIVMISDTMLTSIPVRLFHVIYPMLYSMSYIALTVIYWAVGGTNSSGMPYIYPQTDYTGRPVLSAVSQLCLFFIGLPWCQSLLFGFYKLRVWIKIKCVK